MSIDAITEIREAEREAESLVRKAQQDATFMIKEAETGAKHVLESRETSAAEEAAAVKTGVQAELNYMADEKRKAIAEMVEALRTSAERNRAKALKLAVERIVRTSGHS